MIYSVKQELILKSTPIDIVLASFGCSTEHRHSLKCDQYFSPFRQEHTPSFTVYSHTPNRWIDFGDDSYSDKRKSHSVADLVQRLLEQNGRSHEYNDALDYLAGLNLNVSDPVVREVVRSRVPAPKAESRVTVTKVQQPIWSRSLRAYITDKRHISPVIMDRYLSQVHYSAPYVDRNTGEPAEGRFFAVGFPNRSGGWALRRDAERYGKVSTGAGVTLIRGDGTYDNDAEPKPTCGRLAVFEGFMDFLSWLEIRRVEVPGGFDALVLNSVSNIEKAEAILPAYGEVSCFLDNDKAGDVATSVISDIVTAAGHTCRDRRDGYRNDNDVNDAWLRIGAERARKAAAQKQAAAKTVSVTPAPAVCAAPVEEMSAGRGFRP